MIDAIQTCRHRAAVNPVLSAKVTVLIPTYNRAEFLAECIDSILAQTLPPFQVLVVDDGSSDNTRQIVGSYKARLEYIRTDQLGKAAAINRGMELCRGEYLWIFDDDDVALPDALVRFAEPLVKSQRYGFSFSKFYYAITQPGSNEIGRITGESTIPDVNKRGFLPPLLESNFLGGAALFARIACYKKVGPFEPALFRSQDYEMAIRIVRQFKGVQISGLPTFFYRQHDGLRGPASRCFEARLQKIKWLEYDQMFFGKLLAEIPLHEYLPPGLDLRQFSRHALLQRLAVSITKALDTQACEDLRKLAEMNGVSSFTRAEQDIARTVVTYFLYSKEIQFKKYLGIAASIGRLSKNSKTIRSIRAAMLRGFLADFIRTRSPLRLKRSIKMVRKML